MNNDLLYGVTYCLRYRSHTQMLTREAVMTYLGGDQWSARPIAGTQTIPFDWIISVRRVDVDTPKYLNRIVRLREK